MASILDTPTAVAAATHTFTVSAGNNRCLVVLLQTEGTQSGTMTMTYGGQSMTNVIQQIAGSGTTQQTVALFFLNNAGIVAASGTTLAAGNYGSTDLTIHAASYENCVQTTPTNTDSDSSEAATPNPLAALDITTTAANSIVIAGSGMGNAGSAAWAAPLTERTDQAAGSSNGSIADDEVASSSTLVACECTWTTQNRAAAVAFEIVHLTAEGITSIDPTTFDMDNADVDIIGVNFLTPQGTGDVYLSDANTLAGSANEVDITSAINTWADALINLDLTQLSAGELSSLHTLGPGQRYIIVVNDDSDEYGSDAITLHRPEAFVMSLGAGTPGATTARLEAPSTKTTGDFDAGRFEEASNPATTVDITADDYTEMVFSMEAKPLSREVAYNFRVTANGVALDTYTETPQITISGAEDINASDMSSASTVSAPSIDGVRLIDASDISSLTTVTNASVTVVVEAVDINAQDMSSSTTVTAPVLSHLRDIDASDMSSSTTVTNPSLDGVRDISATDLSSSTTVTAPTVTPLVIIEDVSLWHDAIAIDATDLSSSTTVTSPSLDRIRNINATDLSSATTVTAPSLDGVRAIGAVDLSSSTTVTNAGVTVVTAAIDINAQDLSSSTTVTAPSLDGIRLIDAVDISSATTVTNASVEVLATDINAQDLSSSTTVTSPSLTPIRLIDASDLSSATTVTNPSLDGVRLIDASDLSSATTVVADSELATDGGLENWTGDDLDDWVEIESGSSVVLNEQSVVQSGSNSCKVSIDTAGSVAGIEQLIAFQNGATYFITLYLRKAVSSNDTVYLWDDDAGAGGLNEEIKPPDGVWTEYNFVWTANANSDRIRIRKGYQGTPTAWDFYIDAISVIKPLLRRIRTVDATDLSSATTVTNASVDVDRAINATDLSSSTTVTSPALDGVRAIDASDLSSSTTVENASVEVVSEDVAINAQDLSSSTTVTSPALDAVRLIDASDLSSATTVENASVEVVGAIDINAQDITCQTYVCLTDEDFRFAVDDDFAFVDDTDFEFGSLCEFLTVIRAINAGDLSSSTTVTSPTLDVGAVGINAQNVSSSTTVTSPSLDVIRAIDAVDLSSSTTVTSPSLDVIRAIDAVDLSSATTVTSPSVEVVGVPIDINAVDISCQTTVDPAILNAIRLVDASDLSSATTVSNCPLNKRISITNANYAYTGEALTINDMTNIAITPGAMEYQGRSMTVSGLVDFTKRGIRTLGNILTMR